MPLGDGSANFWIELLRKAIPPNTQHLQGVEVREPITLTKNDRTLLMVPDVSFSVTYLMDLNHPQIGKRWQTWNLSMPVTEISDARTFGSLKEHEMLGLVDDVVSFTPDGFTQKLRFEDEPVRHKLLDLIGDLALVGINPLRLNARFISIKAGHEMDVQLATKLAQVVRK
jgi:UDP-3-O-[3-hydroxymyristoyl] N-acetylglucosamine deacetylase